MKKVLLYLGKLVPKRLLPQFGYYPIDRYYINNFLSEVLAVEDIAISGNSLEFGEVRYTRFFQGTKFAWHYSDVYSAEDRVIKGDILANNYIDLKFDIIVSTQVLPFVSDPVLYFKRVCDLLSPNGVLLLTSPGLGVFTSKYDAVRWGDYGRYSLVMIESFVPKGFAIVFKKGYGCFEILHKFNSNVSALMIKERELDRHAPYEEVIFGIVIKRSDA